jgi:hypothetical protein
MISTYDCSHSMIKKIPYILGFILAATIFISPLFVKVKVECKSQIGNCPDELNSKLQILNYKFMFQAKSKASKILKSDYLISNFSMQFKLPDILFINTIVKKPVYSIFDKSLNKYFLIDISGFILAESDGSDLPNLIKDNLNEKGGQKITDADLFALKLVQGINQMYQVRTGVTQNDTLVVDIPNDLRVILPLDGDVQVLLGSLRLIYTKITADSHMTYSQIDMRFKNPVIR